MYINLVKSTQLNNDISDLNRYMNGILQHDDENDNAILNITHNSDYYELENVNTGVDDDDKLYQYKAMHINIHSLPSFERLKEMILLLKESGIILDFILICESFLRDHNNHLYQINGYNFISKNRQNMNGGGVCMYVRNDIQFKMRDDLSLFYEGQFESLFIETTDNHTIIRSGFMVICRFSGNRRITTVLYVV